MTKKFKISGMSCGHCRNHVAEAILALPGVETVDVDLAESTAKVSGEFTDDAVVKAVADAGYVAVPE